MELSFGSWFEKDLGSLCRGSWCRFLKEDCYRVVLSLCWAGILLWGFYFQAENFASIFPFLFLLLLISLRLNLLFWYSWENLSWIFWFLHLIWHRKMLLPSFLWSVSYLHMPYLERNQEVDMCLNGFSLGLNACFVSFKSFLLTRLRSYQMYRTLCLICHASQLMIFLDRWSYALEL